MPPLTKATGWLLLFLGLAVIFCSLYSSYQIFTGKTAVPVLFKAAPAKADASGGSGLSLQIDKILGLQLQQFLPDNTVPQILNLLGWSIFAGILIFAGSQIASLGIKLMV